VLHVRDADPLMVEQALETIFAKDGCPQTLRLEGTYSAVLGRVTDPDLEARYRYLILRPHEAAWTPVLELGNRTVNIDVELSRALNGCAVFTTFVYGDVVSGYRMARNGVETDQYVSDPTYFQYLEDETSTDPVRTNSIAGDQGHPERFADLLPSGTTPEEFERVVLRPGWWEEHQARYDEPGTTHDTREDDAEDEWVDEVDRMRCMALALELWGSSDYPFAQEPEDIPNAMAGPAIALAFV
jgi:hypothetical protein